MISGRIGIGDAFVDGAGLGFADETEDGMHCSSMLEKTRHMGQTWERALFGTGGRLELPKCFVALV